MVDERYYDLGRLFDEIDALKDRNKALEADLTARIEKLEQRNVVLGAVAVAAVGIKHYRAGSAGSAGMVEISIVTWEKIVAALDKLAALDAAKEGG